MTQILYEYKKAEFCIKSLETLLALSEKSGVSKN